MRKVLLASSVLVSVALGFAQPSFESLKKTSRGDLSTSTSQPFELPGLNLDERSLSSFQAVESAIDPNAYLVGPGDVFTINFWGQAFPEPLLVVPVTPEGLLLIPTVGSLLVNKQTLAQVQAAVSRACAEKYDAVRIRVTTHLSQVRLMRVHVYGEVGAGGSFVASATERVSASLHKAGGLTQWADESRVEIRYADGQIKTLDLTRLYQLGDLEQDPYLQGGEMIFVPRLSLAHDIVFVEGMIGRPGPHRLLANESLLDFLFRVRALDRQKDFRQIFLFRAQQAPLRLSFFDGEARLDGQIALHNGYDRQGSKSVGFAKTMAGQTLQLQSGDRIVVSELKAFVYVHGAVRNPGSYPFVTGYRVADYIGMAGSTAETANLKSAKVMHRDTGRSEKGADREVNRGDTIFIPVSSRKTAGDYLTILSQAAAITFAVVAAINTINAN
jgi:protein involved in polysaccharide export with SLBB domain